ncbi:MAG: single-stranded-DNA-specific exonuclease RecJ [Veillonellaceae bacterium]|nr:single-stranded-DNA-specific exonuclease RecJ [Veillonellaceae bacterium]
MIKRWNILPDAGTEAQALAKALGVSDVLARLLWNRGLRTVDDAQRFLDPEHLQDFYDPFLMKDMKEAVARIAKAIEGGEHITVYGDYDVDGMTSSALLCTCLRALGADADIYIPDRFREGYGFNRAALEKIAETSSLLVSVDCGISSVKDVAGLQGKLDIVVTDHHLPGDTLPPACAIVNPHREDDMYPDKNLCGVGVAFKLCNALSLTLRHEPWEQGLELVALGTVADIVPLLGENRKIVRLGLARMAETQNVGLRALMDVAGVDPSSVTAEQVGFQLAPRLNAAGRMATARLGARLLLTQDAAEAQELADRLNALNQERQAVEQDILARAEEQLAGEDMEQLPAIVLAGEGWHSGVIGIVASRLVETYYKPVILLSIDGGMAKGSCRSIEGLHMHDALAACAEHLTQFGGHAQAAGLSLRTADIPAFRAAFCAYAKAHLSKEDYTPVARIEFEMQPLDVTLDLIEEIARLEPYGEGNPKPLFGARNLRGEGARAIGKDRTHLKFFLSGREQSIEMLWWSHAALAGLVNAEPLDIVYKPSINEWQGSRRVQAIVDSLRPAESARIYPDRAALADLYRFLLSRQKKGGDLPLDPVRLVALFEQDMGRHMALYTLKEGLRVFTELHLLVTTLAEGTCRLVPPAGKLDLMASESFRTHQSLS